MSLEDSHYYLARANQELTAVRDASNCTIGGIHLELAAKYLSMSFRSGGHAIASGSINDLPGAAGDADNFHQIPQSGQA